MRAHSVGERVHTIAVSARQPTRRSVRSLPLRHFRLAGPFCFRVHVKTCGQSRAFPPFFPQAEWTVIVMSDPRRRSEEHTSELQSLMRISYAVFCLNKKNKYEIILMTDIQR